MKAKHNHRHSESIASGEGIMQEGVASGIMQESAASLKAEGYRVLPTELLGEGAQSLYSQYGAMNFAYMSTNAAAVGNGTDADAGGGPYNSFSTVPGGFTSAGCEQPVGKCGTKGKGYIAWGAANNLPNFISILNSMLPYTAAAIKFNVDTACGIGIRPMYRTNSGVAGQFSETEIPFELAGKAIIGRIQALQKEVFNLLKDKENVVFVETSAAEGEGTQSATVPGESSSGIKIITNAPMPAEPQPEEPEQPTAEAPRYPHRSAGADYYKALSCDYLDDIIATYNKQIACLKKDLGIWEKTNKAVETFLKKTNTTLLNHNLFNDLISFGCCFPEIRLTMNGRNQDINTNWKPTIESIGWRNALTCRMEKFDESNVSRNIYISNYWLNTNEQHSAGAEFDIDALPAIDPSCPAYDLKHSLVKFRVDAGRGTEEENRDISRRQCRRVLPITYTTPGRAYYSLPSYWSIYNDIYQFASTIIRDRAIRKQNESMFGYVVYVHSDYLERLTSQLNAQATDAEKQAIKKAEIDKIKSFLRNKRNNGAALAACSFTGNDGKDHDAFRIEQVSMANKNAAEADKTEIADISSIILFALECHPDLIGSTPGGASSKGGTYQREMLQIKQAKLAPTQQMVIEAYNLVRDFNEWDSHLCWHIVQRSLTTLDRSHSGTIDE